MLSDCRDASKWSFHEGWAASQSSLFSGTLQQHLTKLPFQFSTTVLPQVQHSMFSGEQAREDAAQAEYQIRTAAFMGLRIMTDQAVRLAKQGSMIPHLYPERQLSVLSEAPMPLGMAAHDCHPLAPLASDFVTSLNEWRTDCAAAWFCHGSYGKGTHDLLGLPAMSSWCSSQAPRFSKNSLHASQHQKLCLVEQVLPFCQSKYREWLHVLLKQADESAKWCAGKHTNSRPKPLPAEALVCQHMAGAHVTVCSQQVLEMRLLMCASVHASRQQVPVCLQQVWHMRLLVCVCVQAGKGYLSAVPPGEFSQLCEGNLPITMMGADFLHQYGKHYDQQTQVSISSQSCPAVLTSEHWIHKSFDINQERLAVSTAGTFVCHEQGCMWAERPHVSWCTCCDSKQPEVLCVGSLIGQSGQVGTETFLFGTWTVCLNCAWPLLFASMPDTSQSLPGIEDQEHLHQDAMAFVWQDLLPWEQACLVQVSEGCNYKVAVATRHAIMEQQRAKCFSQLLQGPLTTSEQLVNLGELMLQVNACCLEQCCIVWCSQVGVASLHLWCSKQGCLEGADLHRMHLMPVGQVHVLIIVIVVVVVTIYILILLLIMIDIVIIIVVIIVVVNARCYRVQDSDILTDSTNLA